MHGTYPILHRLERLELGKAYISFNRIVSESVFGKERSDQSSLLIGCAVMVGHADNRPMSATKIAYYTGMPRPTVVRKLNELLRTGVIARQGNVYLLSEERARKGRNTSKKRCEFSALRRKG